MRLRELAASTVLIACAAGAALAGQIKTTDIAGFNAAVQQQITVAGLPSTSQPNTWTGAQTFSGGLSGALTGNATSSTKWATPRTLTLSGDVTGAPTALDGSANISITTSLAPVGTAGTYGDATHVPAITTDAHGRVTGVSLVPITGGGGGGSALTVTDGTTSVANTATIKFTGATVTSSATGEADVAISSSGGGGGGGTPVSTAYSTAVGSLSSITTKTDSASGTTLSIAPSTSNGLGMFLRSMDQTVDQQIIARVTTSSMQAGNSSIGLVIRNSSTTTSSMLFLTSNSGGFLEFNNSTDDGSIGGGSPDHQINSLTVLMKMTWTAATSTYNVYASVDGVNWEPYTSGTISSPDTIGFAIRNRSSGGTVPAVGLITMIQDSVAGVNWTATTPLVP